MKLTKPRGNLVAAIDYRDHDEAVPYFVDTEKGQCVIDPFGAVLCNISGEALSTLGIGQTYQIIRYDNHDEGMSGTAYPPLTISESDTRRPFFVPSNGTSLDHRYAGVFVSALPASAGTLHVVIHDTDNNAIATGSIASTAMIANSWCYVPLLTTLEEGQTYHYHIYYVITGGGIQSSGPLLKTSTLYYTYREIIMPPTGSYGMNSIMITDSTGTEVTSIAGASLSGIITAEVSREFLNDPLGMGIAREFTSPLRGSGNVAPCLTIPTTKEGYVVGVAEDKTARTLKLYVYSSGVTELTTGGSVLGSLTLRTWTLSSGGSVLPVGVAYDPVNSLLVTASAINDTVSGVVAGNLKVVALPGVTQSQSVDLGSLAGDQGQGYVGTLHAFMPQVHSGAARLGTVSIAQSGTVAVQRLHVLAASSVIYSIDNTEMVTRWGWTSADMRTGFTYASGNVSSLVVLGTPNYGAKTVPMAIVPNWAQLSSAAEFWNAAATYTLNFTGDTVAEVAALANDSNAFRTLFSGLKYQSGSVMVFIGGANPGSNAPVTLPPQGYGPSKRQYTLSSTTWSHSSSTSLRTNTNAETTLVLSYPPYRDSCLFATIRGEEGVSVTSVGAGMELELQKYSEYVGSAVGFPWLWRLSDDNYATVLGHIAYGGDHVGINRYQSISLLTTLVYTGMVDPRMQSILPDTGKVKAISADLSDDGTWDAWSHGHYVAIDPLSCRVKFPNGTPVTRYRMPHYAKVDLNHFNERNIYRVGANGIERLSDVVDTLKDQTDGWGSYPVTTEATASGLIRTGAPVLTVRGGVIEHPIARYTVAAAMAEPVTAHSQKMVYVPEYDLLVGIAVYPSGCNVSNQGMAAVQTVVVPDENTIAPVQNTMTTPFSGSYLANGTTILSAAHVGSGYIVATLSDNTAMTMKAQANGIVAHLATAAFTVNGAAAAYVLPITDGSNPRGFVAISTAGYASLSTISEAGAITSGSAIALANSPTVQCVSHSFGGNYVSVVGRTGSGPYTHYFYKLTASGVRTLSQETLGTNGNANWTPQYVSMTPSYCYDNYMHVFNTSDFSSVGDSFGWGFSTGSLTLDNPASDVFSVSIVDGRMASHAILYITENGFRMSNPTHVMLYEDLAQSAQCSISLAMHAYWIPGDRFTIVATGRPAGIALNDAGTGETVTVAIAGIVTCYENLVPNTYYGVSLAAKGRISPNYTCYLGTALDNRRLYLDPSRIWFG